MIIERVGIVCAVFGLIAAVAALFALKSLGVVDIHEHAGFAWMARYGALGLIILPVFYALVGFLVGALHAWVYNLAARYVGGIEIETA